MPVQETESRSLEVFLLSAEQPGASATRQQVRLFP